MELVPPTRLPNRVLVFILGFTSGVFISSLVSFAPLISLLVLLLGLSIILVEKIWNDEVSQEVFLISLVLISFSLGALRYAVKDFHEIQIPSETGVVISEPEERENTKRFVFLSQNGGKVLVSAPLYSPVEYGDRVKVAGELERPGIIEGKEGKRDFDYSKYLAKDNIYYTQSFAEVEIVEKGQGNFIKAKLLKLKRSFVEQAREILPEPQASLLTGLIVAGRDALPKSILEEFRRAGVIHIVVLSGFNITLIAEFLRRIFQALLLWFKWSRWPKAPTLISVIGVLLFVVMTGGEATVVRAALMASTVILAGLFGKNYSASRALLAAGFLMVIHNPKILVFDPSFQLSFLATLGLIHVMPLLEEKLRFVTEKFGLKEIVAQTLSTQITVLPLLVYSIGDLSLVSLPANILILVVVPWTMLIGFIAVLLSYLSFLISWPVAFVGHILLSWILFVSHFFGSLSFATIKIPLNSFGVVFLFYLLLIWIIIWWRSQNSPQSPSN